MVPHDNREKGLHSVSLQLAATFRTPWVRYRRFADTRASNGTGGHLRSGGLVDCVGPRKVGIGQDHVRRFRQRQGACYTFAMRLFRSLRRFWGQRLEDSNDPGKVVVEGVDHRGYVGGFWDDLGALQFRFMTGHGLLPRHVLLDIACGSLRAGRRFIPYLDAGNYLGLDAKAELIEAGKQHEIDNAMLESKRPEFVNSEDFEFERFSKRPDFALAHALFIHLPEETILACLSKVRAIAKPGTRCYVTYALGSRPSRIDLGKHTFVFFVHTKKQMLRFGEQTGWKSRYIGEWGHPRGQVMVEYST
jgi:SAM-dependent methyltransferase